MEIGIMKKHLLLTLVIVLLTACEKDTVDNPQVSDIDFRQEMRNFVQKISQYAKGIDNDFMIIPQNGQELIIQNGEPDGSPMLDYLASIDGTGREDLFYGYDNDNEPTPRDDKNYLIAFCDICKQNDIEVLTTDYCSAHDKMDNSYVLNQAKGYISFAAPERELNVIPDYPLQPFHVNSNDILTLKDAKNFLYLINPERFATKQDFINAVSATDYDLIIMDYFFNDQAFSTSEIAQLKTKHNTGKRLVVSYLSIGEVEDYRYYWRNDWEINPPDWLEDENPDWEGNYKVKYWKEDWQNIIYATDNSYLKKLLDAGFDGVYLDIIDAFEYFEEINN
jgi:cysteinyl-tRNA synthetase